MPMIVTYVNMFVKNLQFKTCSLDYVLLESAVINQMYFCNIILSIFSDGNTVMSLIFVNIIELCVL